MIKRVLVSIAVITAIASVAWGATLGVDLTPAGAEKGGNKDGTIPAWEGKDVPSAGWAYGKYRGDYSKYKGEKPLFSIDASNVDKYKDKLSPGQVEFIKQTKGYRMDVYPSHRNAGFPDFVEANTKKNAASAKLGADGWSLKEAFLPGIPFPIPKNGAEAMWNFQVRYRGVGVEWPDTHTVASPRPGSTEWIETHGPQTVYLPWGKKGATTPAQVNDRAYSIYFAYQSPPALAGQAITQTYYFSKPNETSYYFPGQRRVRRMPSYAYDSPQIGFENQYTLDQPWIFNGNLDRFDWKLVGKKEMYVPYNSFGMYNFNAKLHDVLLPKFLSPDYRRYELHRVWVVEATVKKGMRHLAPKRLFYIDEDSWLALVADDYDAQGKLWKVREGFAIPVWELGGSFDLESFVQYDLISGRYVQDQSPFSSGKDIKWHPETTDKRFKDDYYTAETLRAISER
jgi:hypothetical protein